MLLELNISDFAIIERLRLTLGPGFNVFTGETGAGKSIIVDAITALVGERMGADVVRAGSERATVEGVFDVSDVLAREGRSEGATEDMAAGSLGASLAELGIEAEDGMLILGREMTAAGRGLARVNGRTAPLSTLQRLSAGLIDIHGQSAHLALLRPERHIYYLDRYAGLDEAREEVAALYAEWRATRRELERLRADEREIERRIELLRFQVEEIAAATLKPGEVEELERERRMLSNAERLGELTAAVYGALRGDEAGDERGALDLLAEARRGLTDLLRLDETLGAQSETLDQAIFLLEDVASGARDYQDQVMADPARLAEVEERLDLINRLRRKYGATIEEMLAFADEAARELEGLLNREERAAELQQREERLRERIGVVAGRLSARRGEAARELAQAMERQLDDLNMRKARFEVRLARRPDPGGVPAGDEGRVAFSATGIDQVEFLLAPNPGEPLKPLARIASGGETSRLMLAIKTILASADATPTLIFDEIDAGISGRSGQVVGEKLWALGQTHQALCVTHLPQIAALGDRHFQVSKVVSGERTMTHVTPLDGDARVAELSQMLGGASTNASRANARDLLSRAEDWKRERLAQDVTA
ncbi:MAG TPA: DNA repair protein RecN [Ktedonobacterales bacterium]|nr:DNA repair protein RecN [Ktedonobacterales bacterium]